MNVQILSVEPYTANKPASNHVRMSGPRFKVGFRAEYAEGTALFVPYGGSSEPPVISAMYSVEMDYDSISGFQRCDKNKELGILKRKDCCDYDVIAVVAMVSDQDVLDVIVGRFEKPDTGGFTIPGTSFFLALDYGDTLGTMPVANDVVSFRVHGLTLYDQGYCSPSKTSPRQVSTTVY